MYMYTSVLQDMLSPSVLAEKVVGLTTQGQQITLGCFLNVGLGYSSTWLSNTAQLLCLKLWGHESRPVGLEPLLEPKFGESKINIEKKHV